VEIGTTAKGNKIDGGQGGAKSPRHIDWLKGNFLNSTRATVEFELNPDGLLGTLP
jgi:hypothetical protein